MKRHGITIDKTRKYSFEEIRQVCHQYMGPLLMDATLEVQELHVMAFKDYIKEHCPKIDVDRAVRDYCDLVMKYTEDKYNGNFTLADVKKYNRESEGENLDRA